MIICAAIVFQIESRIHIYISSLLKIQNIYEKITNIAR